MFPLFAEEISTGSWVGVGFAFVAMIGAAINTISARKERRDRLDFEAKVAKDKLEHDATIATQAAQIEACHAAHKQCEDERKVDRERIEEYKGENQEMCERITVLEAKVP